MSESSVALTASDASMHTGQMIRTIVSICQSRTYMRLFLIS